MVSSTRYLTQRPSGRYKKQRSPFPSLPVHSEGSDELMESSSPQSGQEATRSTVSAGTGSMREVMTGLGSAYDLEVSARTPLAKKEHLRQLGHHHHEGMVGGGQDMGGQSMVHVRHYSGRLMDSPVLEELANEDDTAD